MCAQSHYWLDVQKGTVASRLRGEIPCTLEATRYRFPSQIRHDYPTGITPYGSNSDSHKTPVLHYTIVLPEAREHPVIFKPSFSFHSVCHSPAFILTHLLPATQDCVTF